MCSQVQGNETLRGHCLRTAFTDNNTLNSSPGKHPMPKRNCKCQTVTVSSPSPGVLVPLSAERTFSPTGICSKILSQSQLSKQAFSASNESNPQCIYFLSLTVLECTRIKHKNSCISYILHFALHQPHTVAEGVYSFEESSLLELCLIIWGTFLIDPLGVVPKALTFPSTNNIVINHIIHLFPQLTQHVPQHFFYLSPLAALF